MAVSQKQIAEKLGVSVALVSRVLTGRAQEIGIAPDTIERVAKTAEEMGYVPSAAALSLKGKPTRTVGVTVYDFNDPFFGELIREIQTQAHQHDYSLVLAGFLNRVPNKQDLQPLYKHAIEGLIVLGSDTESRWLQDFAHLPVARIGHGSPDDPGFKITIDEEDAAGQIVRHLCDGGKNNAVGITGTFPAHPLRKKAFEKAAQAGGIKSVFFTPPERNPFTAGLQTVRQLIETAALPAALVCASDQIAMGALRALHDADINVPGQIAVTGFDDIPPSAQFIPSLTTVGQPIKEMVEQAFQTVISNPSSQTVFLPGKLIIRETT